MISALIANILKTECLVGPSTEILDAIASLHQVGTFVAFVVCEEAENDFACWSRKGCDEGNRDGREQCRVESHDFTQDNED